MQLTNLFSEFDELQQKHGSSKLSAIYGCGETINPNLCLVFMNPTGRNVSAEKNWSGIRAPWIGTKQVWQMLNELGLMDNKILNELNSKKPSEWSSEFAFELYSAVKSNSLYITNLSKATQIDARPIPNSVFLDYLDLFKKEISLIKPKVIIAFGNQVSSIILGKPISVSKYRKKFELLKIGEEYFKVYPVFYPVGQGTPNMKYAKKDILWIIKNNKK